MSDSPPAVEPRTTFDADWADEFAEQEGILVAPHMKSPAERLRHFLRNEPEALADLTAIEDNEGEGMVWHYCDYDSPHHLADKAGATRALDDDNLASHLAVAMVAAGNPSQYPNVGAHAKAIIRELHRQQVARLSLGETEANR